MFAGVVSSLIERAASELSSWFNRSSSFDSFAAVQKLQRKDEAEFWVS